MFGCSFSILERQEDRTTLTYNIILHDCPQRNSEGVSLNSAIARGYRSLLCHASKDRQSRHNSYAQDMASIITHPGVKMVGIGSQ